MRAVRYCHMRFTETAHHNLGHDPGRSAVTTAALDDEVRLMDSSFFMSYPHDVYTRMRREQPVYWSERDGVWALTKYDDIRYASKTPELFANEYHVYVTAARHADDGD